MVNVQIPERDARYAVFPGFGDLPWYTNSDSFSS